VQWQQSTDDGMINSNIRGATAATPSLANVTNAMSGHQQSAVFSNESPLVPGHIVAASPPFERRWVPNRPSAAKSVAGISSATAAVAPNR